VCHRARANEHRSGAPHGEVEVATVAPTSAGALTIELVTFEFFLDDEF
jgi:hypothetical protein